MGNPVDMSIELAGVRLQNPVMPASGTFGYGQEYKDVFDLNKLGALVTKSITKEPRYGNELPRIAECTSGMLNSIGLQNPGLEHFREVDLPELRKIYRGPIVANISGFSVDEYREVAAKVDREEQVEILEINISCPNVDHGGSAFGSNPKLDYPGGSGRDKKTYFYEADSECAGHHRDCEGVRKRRCRRHQLD